MNELTNLANKLNLTVNMTRAIIKKYGYKSANLTPEITDYIYRQEKGINQEVFTGTSEPIKTASDTPVDGVSYLELVEDETQAQTLFSLAKTFGIDPNNIPRDEVEILKSMLGEAEISEQADKFLDDSERALIASQATDIKLKVVTAQDVGELSADIVFKAGKSAYNRRLLELMADDREEFQEVSEQLQSGMVQLLKAPEFSVDGYQQRAIEGSNQFTKKKSRRLALIQRK
ncbi:MAG: hypothetical protein ACOVOV_18785 [Dolichospermum sp.]